MSNTQIKLKALEVAQPIGVFYVAVIGHKDLVHVSHVDVRRLESKTGAREVEEFIGIQRPLSENRAKEIKQYVTHVDATFPTSIILHVDEKDASYDNSTGILTLESRDDVAKVLDGQHRIAGLVDSELSNDKFELNVTIFVGMELEDQAIVFATINKTQAKVNKSLVADLFAFAKDRSPQRTAHVVARALNQKEDSAFNGKIKILGTAIDKDKETITQATFVDWVIKYISGSDSKRAMRDRDIYKRGKIPDKAEGSEVERLFLRNMFIDEKDTDIAKLINNYFLAVAKKWPEAWNNVTPEMILNRTTGFAALMRFFKDAYLSFDRIGTVVTVDEFSAIFSKIDIKENDLNKNTYAPGGAGISKLYSELLQKSGLSGS